jgi:hypothetical protein
MYNIGGEITDKSRYSTAEIEDGMSIAIELCDNFDENIAPIWISMNSIVRTKNEITKGIYRNSPLRKYFSPKV